MQLTFDKHVWKEHAKRMFAGFDKPLALIVFLLLCVGIVTLYSASIDMPGRVEDQLRNIMLTFGLMWVLANIPPQTLMRFAVPLYTVGVALLIAVAAFGLTRKGAKRWLNVGVVIQPSEIMKIAMPLMLAWYYQRREGNIRWWDYVAGFVILLLPVALIAKQPDLGTAVLVFAAGDVRHLFRRAQFQADRAGARGGRGRHRVRGGVPEPHLPARSELADDARLSKSIVSARCSIRLQTRSAKAFTPFRR